MKRGLILVFLLIVLVGFASAENHYVAQNSAGTGTGDTYENRMSISIFNSASKWTSIDNDNDNLIGPGDIVYFSGTITSQVAPPEGYGGSASGGYVTLDGYQADDTTYANLNEAAGRCVIDRGAGESNTYIGMRLDGVSYINVQDFEVVDLGNGYAFYVLGEAHDILFRRNFIHSNSYSNDRIESGITLVGGSYNVIVGGALGQGNVVKDCGVDTGDEDIAISNAHDIIISYNHLYGTDDLPEFSIDGVMTDGGGYNVLIEYNEIHGHNSNIGKGEDGIDLKKPTTHDYIIRFNHIYDNDYQSGITVQSSAHDVYIYGNFVHQVNNFGLDIGEVDVDDVYMWSNIITDSKHGNLLVYKEASGSSADGYPIDIWASNNILAYGGDDVDEDDDETNLIAAGIAGTFTFKNNIIYKGRPDRSNWQYRQAYVTEETVSHIDSDYNTWYWPGQTSEFYWGSTIGSTNLAGVVTGTDDEDNSIEIDPGFNNPDGVDYTEGNSDDDFTLDGTHVDNGVDLSQCYSITIQGVEYNPCTSEALDPHYTDWTTIPPTVYTLDQNDYGSWERGAYVYTGGATQTCSNQGYNCCSSAECQGTHYSSFDATCSGQICCDSCSTTPTCPQGQITSTCLCGGVEYSSGYCCSGTWQSTTCSAGTYAYTIKRTSSPPTINGDINEFADANGITLINSQGTSGTYRFMWDDDALYIAADVSDANLNADLSHGEDSSIYSDDSFEVMFDTADNGGASIDYDDDFKFYVNVNNVHTDSQRYNTTWDSGMTKAVTYSQSINNNGDVDTGYTIEIRIPWSGFVTVPTEDVSVWGMNFALNDKPDATTYPEQTVWLGSSTNVPDDAGDVLFSSEVVTSGSSCSSGADGNDDSVVSITELINYIGQWKSGIVNITELINAIGEWKAGC